MKYRVDLGAFLTVFSALELEVEAGNPLAAGEIARDLARDTWREIYPDLHETGTITIDEVEEIEE